MNVYWLDYYQSKEIKPLVDCYYKRLETYFIQKLLKQRINKKKLTNAVCSFVCNTMRAINNPEKDGSVCVKIPLCENVYSRIINGRKTPKISYSYTRAMLDYLVMQDYINLEIGGVVSWKLDRYGEFIPDETTYSKYQPTTKLIEEFFPFLKHEKEWLLDNVLILKDRKDKTKCIPFKLTGKAIKMINVLNSMNKTLYYADIRFEGKQIKNIQYKRVFKADFNTFGRFYTNSGEVQCMNSKLRKTIQINGENVVELDFSALHPRILAERDGVILEDDFDPYTIDWKKYGTCPKQVRKLVKLSMLRMLNCGCIQSARYSIGEIFYDEDQKPPELKEFDKIDPDLLIGEFINDIHMYNMYLENYLYEEYGGLLQNTDSKITERIINYFNKKKEVVLTIHDSYIVRESLEDELRQVMRDSYKYVTGSDHNCKIDKK